MRNILAIVVMFVLLGSAVLAKEHTFHACTSDAFHVAITMDLDDAVIKKNPKIPANIAIAFKATATALRLDQFLSDEGYVLFMSKLSTEDRQAMPTRLDYPALLGNDCVAK